MPDTDDVKSEVTVLLQQLAEGDRGVESRLFRLLEDDLRRAARAFLRDETSTSRNTTMLIDDVFVRLARGVDSWESRKHFLRLAARAMRRILVDEARSRKAGKREHARAHVEVGYLAGPYRSTDLTRLDDALDALRERDSRKAEVVELRYFGGYDRVEIARILEISPSTVDNDWKFARAWLRREMGDGDDRADQRD